MNGEGPLGRLRFWRELAVICGVIVVWRWRLRWHGDGVEADRAAALKWYRRAAERGYEPARIAIDALAE